PPRARVIARAIDAASAAYESVVVLVPFVSAVVQPSDGHLRNRIPPAMHSRAEIAHALDPSVELNAGWRIGRHFDVAVAVRITRKWHRAQRAARIDDVDALLGVVLAASVPADEKQRSRPLAGQP